MKPGDMVRFKGPHVGLGIGLILGEFNRDLFGSDYYYLLTREGRKLIPQIYFEVLR